MGSIESGKYADNIADAADGLKSALVAAMGANISPEEKDRNGSTVRAWLAAVDAASGKFLAGSAESPMSFES
jgi:hypothetical protein